MNVTFTGGNKKPFNPRDADSPDSPLHNTKVTQKTPNSDSSDNSSLDNRYNTPNNKKISGKKKSKPSQGLRIKVER